MRIALTGATGLVGKHCVTRFQAHGHQVRAWYRGPQPPSIEGVDWVPGELDDPQAAPRLVRGCDAVVHTALSRADASFMAEPKDPAAYFQTNVVGSLRLLEAAQAVGVSRFVFLSSGAVHEKVADDLPLDERHPLWPASLYGAGKASVETLVHAYGLSGKLNAATLRPVSIIGLDDPPSKSKWFSLVQSVVNHDTVDASGGGKVIYVDELVSAIIALLQTDQPIAGETFNACSGFVSHHQIVQIAKQLSESTSELSGEPKSPGRKMETSKLQQIGVKLGSEDWLASHVGKLVELAKSRR